MNQTVEFLIPFAKILICVDSSADLSLLKTKFLENNISLLPIMEKKMLAFTEEKLCGKS
jgi:hypothetical protein